MKIELRDIEMRFGARTVFSNLTRTVEPGTHLVLTGPNGSGKSTLLKVMGGLLTPTRGEVQWEASTNRSEVRKRLGYVGPDLTLYDDLTVAENLEFFHAFEDAPAASATQHLEALGLHDRRDSRYGSLSTGLKQRTKLAFALLKNPALLLLDEPSLGLDPQGRKLIPWLMALEPNRTVVLATNDPSEFELGKENLELG